MAWNLILSEAPLSRPKFQVLKKSERKRMTVNVKITGAGRRKVAATAVERWISRFFINLFLPNPAILSGWQQIHSYLEYSDGGTLSAITG
jgi:hypothetical protein